jgi:hypothetical protein
MIITMFFKKSVIKFVYNAYIDGLTVEEIAFKYRLYKKEEIGFDEINSIIDDVNLIK